MKISIINGSPRRNGATAILLHEIETQLNSFGSLETTYYNISDFGMRFCNGCEKCYSTGNCVIKSDDLTNIVENVKKSDAIIIGTPTHGSNVSAMLKNFMDRGHFIVEQSLYGKKCMAVTSYEIADGIAAKKVIEKFFVVSGGSVVSSILVKSGFNKNPLTEKLKARIKKQCNKLYLAVKTNRRKSMFEFLFNDIIVVNVIWKPFFRKNADQYKGILEKYKKAGIHKRVTSSLV